MGNLQDYGFPFNSIASDRTYNANDWRKYFNILTTDGVVDVFGEELEVKAQLTPDKSVVVNTGAILIDGATREIDADLTINISDNTSGSVRVDRIIARLDYNNRLIEFSVLEGTPGAGAPALTRTSVIHEMSLAKIELANGFSTITDIMITDERDDETVCGYSSFRLQSIPTGIIMMWSGLISAIPLGYALCDGTNGTPDLRNRFIVGAGDNYSPGNTGGADSVALTEAQLPAHKHTGTTNTTGSHTHNYEWGGDAGGSYPRAVAGQGGTTSPTTSAGSHAHTLNINNAGSGESHENRPPYYALAYIMKV